MEERPSHRSPPAGRRRTSRELTPYQRWAEEQVGRLLLLVRLELRRAGESLQGLEHSLGWRRGYLSQLLRGTIYLKAHHLFTLARVIGFDAGEMLAALCASSDASRMPSPAGASASVRELAQAEDSSAAARISPAKIHAVVAELVECQLTAGVAPQVARAEGAARPAPPPLGEPPLPSEGAESIRQPADSPRQLAVQLMAHLRGSIFEKGVSFRELAKVLGWGKGTVYATLSAKGQLTMLCLFEVLAGLGADPGHFFGEFFGFPPGGEGGEESRPDSAAGSGTEPSREEASLGEAALLRIAVRAMLAPLVAELVEEYLEANSA